MRALQQDLRTFLLVQAGRNFLACLVGRNGRHRGRGAARLRHELDQQRAIVRHPGERIADD